MVEHYAPGDVVEGRFSADPLRRVRAIVAGRVPAGREAAGFFGNVLDFVDGKGYGTWGYDTEIESVRPSTPEDGARAAEVQRRVSAQTDAYIAGLSSNA